MGKYVNPIKNKRERQMLIDALKEQSERNRMLGILGLTTGLRLCDLTRLIVKDIRDAEKVRDMDNCIYYVIKVVEKKTQKDRELYLTQTIYDEVYEYCRNKPRYEFLFKSRNGRNKKLSERQASRIIKETADLIGLDYAVSGHSLRKSYAFTIYEDTKDINLVADMLNHSNTMVTRRYIGIDKEAKYKASKNMCKNIL